MTDIAKSSVLLSALRQLLPGGIFSVTHERPWYSGAFTGTQLGLLANVSGEIHQSVAMEFARILPDHDFTLSGQFVADIAITGQTVDENETRLCIEALLLSD
jgi:hypothetical protein